MNLVLGAMPYFLWPFLFSFLMVPICKQIGFRLGIYAEENNRTVHEGRIVRMGGVAIYVAFFLGLTLLWSGDETLEGFLLGGFFVFMGGLLDDIYNLSAKKKLLFQIAGALVAMFYGQLVLERVNFFGIVFTTPIITYGVSFFWILGITNAINLIDGLDGLSSGISAIVTLTIGLLGFFMQRRDICVFSLVLAGSILGFLPYNFHPASIFVGDCGAQFMGYAIACISLLGFKTTTLISLGLPILLLFIPISDTLLAILRRKLKGVKISEADRGHLHHILMFKLKLGHKKTVLYLYLSTCLFSLAAILSYFAPKAGFWMILILLLGANIFVEYTGMLNPLYHPILSFTKKIFGWPKMLEGEDPLDSKYLEEHKVYDNKSGKEKDLKE